MYYRINQFGIKRKNDFDFKFQLWRKEKQQKFLGKEPTNYLNGKVVEKEEQKPIQEPRKSQKRKMLEEKLEENTKAMKRLKRIKSDSK